MAIVLEVLTFRLMPERSAATFNEAVVRSTRFLARQSGFLRREVGAMERGRMDRPHPLDRSRCRSASRQSVQRRSRNTGFRR